MSEEASKAIITGVWFDLDDLSLFADAMHPKRNLPLATWLHRRAHRLPP